jgi:hypothetical protein
LPRQLTRKELKRPLASVKYGSSMAVRLAGISTAAVEVTAGTF